MTVLGTGSSSITRQRIRIHFGKTGTLRFIGHLDLAKMWERVLRRADLPIEYTQGFNRRPRIQLADALPLGITSDAELIDVWLVEEIEITPTVLKNLQVVSPADLKIYKVEVIDVKTPALPTLTLAADYRIQPANEHQFPADLEARIQRLLSSDTLLRKRKDRAYDLRPLIHDLALRDQKTLHAKLALGEGTTGRPDELLDELGLDILQLRIHREALRLREGSS